MKVLCFILICLQIVAGWDQISLENTNVTKCEKVHFDNLQIIRLMEIREYRYTNGNVSRDDVYIQISPLKLTFADDIIKRVKLDILYDKDILENIYDQLITMPTVTISIKQNHIHQYPNYIFTFYTSEDNLYRNTSYNISYQEEIFHRVTFKKDSDTWTYFSKIYDNFDFWGTLNVVCLVMFIFVITGHSMNNMPKFQNIKTLIKDIMVLYGGMTFVTLCLVFFLNLFYFPRRR